MVQALAHYAQGAISWAIREPKSEFLRRNAFSVALKVLFFKYLQGNPRNARGCPRVARSFQWITASQAGKASGGG